MTIHINDFEKPAALEEKRLQELTGCPIHKAIEAACTEPGCPNNGSLVQVMPHFHLEDCLLDAERQEQGNEGGKRRQIFQTSPKVRCIL